MGFSMGLIKENRQYPLYELLQSETRFAKKSDVTVGTKQDPDAALRAATTRPRALGLGRPAEELFARVNGESGAL